tara:strand:+ start:520 stop:861 length:342 start_codon:yes stop_codon:yes gene_type:complete
MTDAEDIHMIKLTMTEIKLVQEALHAFDPEGTDWEQIDINELADDIREQNARPEWGWPEKGQTFLVAEDDFFDIGAKAREAQRAQAISNAQQQRDRMMKGTITAFISNDPVDW